MSNDDLCARLFSKAICLVVIMYLSGCTLDTVKETSDYVRTERTIAERLKNWSFDGRIAVVSKDESWSGSMNWKQVDEQGVVRISGPLGQGGLEIMINGANISINDGESVIEYSAQDEALITNELGFFVPIRSLVYWIRGVVNPETGFVDIDRGFMQGGWQILFKAMQETVVGLMPHKINFTNDAVSLKLIVDQWVIND